MAERKTMTLNLTDDEMSSLEALSARYDMSKTAILRKALRMYQVIQERVQRGEKLYLEDEIENKKAELVVL
jgi:predicted transcriptional regulator